MKKKKWLGLAGLALSVALCGTAAACGKNGGQNPPGSKGDTYEDYDDSKDPGNGQFDYDGNFAEPELTIDGKADEEIWQNTPVLTSFGKGATVKVYRGKAALFFYFDVKDSVLLTEGETNDDAVTRSDSIELYLDTKADGGSMPMSDDFQLNLAIHGKTRITKGAGAPRSWGTWNGLVDYEFELNGTRNDNTDANDVGYSIEVMIPYAELMIERDTTIGVAFAQVDKTGFGSEVDKDWTWNGWTYDGVFVEPQTIENYVLMSYHPDDPENPNHLTIRDKVPMPAATVEGTVKDENGNFIEGARVTLSGTDKTATTDSIGHFYIENVDSEGTYTVIVEKSGYLAAQAVYSREELRKANGGSVSKDFTLTSTATLTYTTLKGTIKNVVEGAVGGATVTVKNTTINTTAAADGTFELANVPANNGAVTIVVSKAGYGDSETIIPEDRLTEGETVLGDVNLNLPWADMGTFAAKSAFFTSAETKLSRTLTGIQMNFNGKDLLSGHLEVYIDTKESGTDRNADSTAWVFNLNDNGTVTGRRFGNKPFTTEGLVWTIDRNDSNGFVGSFFIPYTVLEIGTFEVFGIEFGQWSETAKDWDGWTACPVGSAPVAENPTTWLRVGATNNLYRAVNNESTANLSGNVGQAGVLVSVGGQSVVSAQDGSWSIVIASTVNAVDVRFSKQGYVTVTKRIEAGYFETHFSWSENITLQEQKVTVTGTVTESDGVTPVAGVTVTIEGTEFTATTDENGVYTIENVGTFNSVKLIFTKTGYAEGSETVTAATLATQESHMVNKSLISNSDIREITVTGKIVGITGAVSGAEIKLNGNIVATTGADGTFSIGEFAGVDCTLSVVKNGFIAGMINFSASALSTGDTTYKFDDLFLVREYAEFGQLEEKTATTQHPDKPEHFVDFTGYVTRSNDALLIKFVGTRAWKSTTNLEVYFNITDGVAKEKKFILNNDTVKSGSDWSVLIENAGSAPVVYLTVSYAHLGVSPTAIVGITAGQWSTGVSDWDTWKQGGSTVNADDASTYVRLAADNTVFRYASNVMFVTLSGNAGAGVTVSANGKSVTANESGDWSLLLDKTSSEITVTFAKNGYVTQTQTIAAGYFDDATSWTAENVTLSLRQIQISGNVSDVNGGIAGVTVSVEGTEWTATTDASGNYNLTVTALKGIKITFTKTGYADGNQSYTAADLLAAANDEISLNVTMISNSDINEVTLSGTVTGIGGAVAGATVEVKGTSYTATTGEDGTWTMSANGVDCTVTVSKTGYIDGKLELKASEIVNNAHAFGEIFLVREYAEFAKSQKTVNPTENNAGIMAGFSYTMTRGKDGFLFRFVGDKPFSTTAEINRVELNISKADATDWSFIININANPNLSNRIVFVKGSGTGVNVEMSDLDSDKPIIEISVPYANAGVTATDTIRIAGGQFCKASSGEDWNGMNINGGYVGAGWNEAHRIYVNKDNTASDNLDDVQTASLANFALIDERRKDAE